MNRELTVKKHSIHRFIAVQMDALTLDLPDFLDKGGVPVTRPFLGLQMDGSRIRHLPLCRSTMRLTAKI